MAFPSWLPLGLGIRDYHESGERTIINVLTKDGSKTHYPAELFFRSSEDFGIFDELACQYANGHVLDVGAGAGCITLGLQDLGFDVTAIEISPEAVEVMKDLGVKDARCGDFFELKEEQWDTILLLMNGIGFTGNLEGLARFLKHVDTILKPGGQILFDSSDLGMADLNASDFTGEASKYDGEVWYQLEYKGIKGAPYYWLYVDQKTMAKYAAEAGFYFELIDEGQEGYYFARLTRLEEEFEFG